MTHIHDSLLIILREVGVAAARIFLKVDEKGKREKS